MRPARSSVEARLAGELGGEPGGRDAGGPDGGAGADRARPRRRVSDRDRVGGDVDDGVCGQRRDAELFERARRLPRERLGEAAGRTRSAASTSRTRAVRVSTQRKSRRRASWASSAICPAISTPVGPAPTTTNVSQAPPPLRVGLDLGRLERGEDAAADLERAVERLQLGRVRLPFVVAEVRVVRAAGDDRACRSRAVGRVAVRQTPSRTTSRRSRSKPVDLGEDDARVALPAEDRAQRGGDLGRRERAGRDLVDERLEERVVLAVDERHLDRRAAQAADRLQAREAAADHDHRGAPLMPPPPARPAPRPARRSCRRSRARGSGRTTRPRRRRRRSRR